MNDNDKCILIKKSEYDGLKKMKRDYNTLSYKYNTLKDDYNKLSAKYKDIEQNGSIKEININFSTTIKTDWDRWDGRFYVTEFNPSICKGIVDFGKNQGYITNISTSYDESGNISFGGKIESFILSICSKVEHSTLEHIEKMVKPKVDELHRRISKLEDKNEKLWNAIHKHNKYSWFHKISIDV